MSATIGTKIDHVINETERALSIGAAIPVIGTVAGLSKVLMGVAQTIVGVVGGIFTLPARCMDNSELNDHFWKHAAHGLGNIAVGQLEALPIVETGMYLVRARNHKENYAYVSSSRMFFKTTLKTTHEDKFMPYESLCKRDQVMGVTR